MDIKEALDFLTENENNEIINKYHECLRVKNEFERINIPETKYFMSSKKYNYYIEQPYKSVEFINGKYEIITRGYNGIGKSNDEKLSINFCQSLCNRTEEYIKTSIKRHILVDNGEEKI